MRLELMTNELLRKEKSTGESKESEGLKNPKQNSREKENAVTCSTFSQETEEDSC